MQLQDFIREGMTPYHVQSVLVRELSAHGFCELTEIDAVPLKSGNAYYLRRGEGLIAFRVGSSPRLAVAACHTDSPCFKLKQSPDADGVVLTEPYGGALRYTWFDRELGIAGRVYYRRDGKVGAANVDLGDSVVIPSVAIHFNRNVNAGFEPNPAVDFNAFSGSPVLPRLASQLGCAADEILSHDLMLYVKSQPYTVDGHYLCAPRIDNLASAWAMLEALKDGSKDRTALAYFSTHEEVGSQTASGAGGTFLKDVVARLADHFGLSLGALCARTWMLSVDNAHASHPNHPELTRGTDGCTLGCGAVIKFNASNRYTTTAETAAAVKALAARAGVGAGTFSMRSDLPCGSTLGAVSSSQLSVRCADIGIPQLAMHAASELCDLDDCEAMRKLLTEFYRTPIEFEQEILLSR